MKEKYAGFFQRLDELDSGSRAALRRAAGTMLWEASGQAVSTFFSVIPPWIPESETDRWFTIACLRCLWDAGEMSDIPLEKQIGFLLRSGTLSESTGHRVEVLMDTAWDSDGFLCTKLTRMVKMLKRNLNAAPDFSVLLDDLLYWNNEKQTVQRRWARAVFTADNAENRKES